MWHHDVTSARTCQFFRRLFDRLPVRISTSDLHHRILRKKLYHIRDYDFGVQFSFKKQACSGQPRRPCSNPGMPLQCTAFDPEPLSICGLDSTVG